MKRRLVLGAALAACAAALNAQTLSFFREFNASGFDRGEAVVADASGVYVIGASHTGGRAGVRKYDSGGNELWTREFAGAPLRAALDLSGLYVVAAAAPEGRFALRKYNAAGDVLWIRDIGFGGPGDIAADSTGVYVAGREVVPPLTTYLRKYSPEGAELWTKQWGDVSHIDNPHSVTADATGVYVFGIAGRFGPALSSPYLSARKFDPRGNELWNRDLGAPGLFGAAAGSDGFYLARAGNELRRYDSSGELIWVRQTATSGPLNSNSMKATSVAADSTGVYAVAATTLIGGPLPGQCRSGAGGDSFVRKYDPAGRELWTRQFGTSQATWASGVALDAAGVYVVGETGAAQVRDATERFAAFAPAMPARSAFLARLEKASAPVAAGRPRIVPGCVVNAASFIGGGVAPGEIVTLFGADIGPSQLTTFRLTEDRRIPTTLADTRVLFEGIPAPLLYVSGTQTTAIVPYAVRGRSSVAVQVEYRGALSDVLTVTVLPARPGVFTLDASGQGQAAALNEDGTLNSPSNPAHAGSVVTFFATGGGEAAPGLSDGDIVGSALPRTALPVSLLFDLDAEEFQHESKPADVLYAGGVPGSVGGLLQINARVPANITERGDAVPFMLIIGSEWTLYQATIALR